MRTPDEERTLEDYRTMMGPTKGNLMFLLDSLTDVMAIVAQHRVYCRVEKGPRAGEGSLDVEEAVQQLQRCKDLLQETLAEIGATSDERPESSTGE